MGFFSPQRSTAKPAGIYITPYAMKNANGRMAAIVSDTWKPAMMSGTNGPRIFVRKEITKNTKTRPPPEIGFCLKWQRALWMSLSFDRPR